MRLVCLIPRFDSTTEQPNSWTEKTKFIYFLQSLPPASVWVDFSYDGPATAAPKQIINFPFRRAIHKYQCIALPCRHVWMEILQHLWYCWRSMVTWLCTQRADISNERTTDENKRKNTKIGNNKLRITIAWKRDYQITWWFYRMLCVVRNGWEWDSHRRERKLENKHEKTSFSIADDTHCVRTTKDKLSHFHWRIRCSWFTRVNQTMNPAFMVAYALRSLL